MSRRYDPDQRCLPLEEWPAADRAAWEAALLPPDPLEPGAGRGHKWKPSTRNLILNGYGRWLGWLTRGGELDPGADPAARPTRDRVSRYLAMLQAKGLADYTVSGRLQQLGNALSAMRPDGDWRWILRGYTRLRAQDRPAKNVDERIQPADEVLAVAMNLMRAAEEDPFHNNMTRALLYRDGLMLALLVHRPLRLANLSGIEVGGQLQRHGADWRLSFPASEMKNGRPYECSWPDALVAPLERYLVAYRPTLLAGAADDADPTEGLWVSQRGRMMRPNDVHFRIVKATRDAFGVPINPHAFRHMAATRIATENPDNITDVMAMLGHASLETSEAHYNRAKMLDAGERHQATITAKRARACRSRRAG